MAPASPFAPRRSPIAWARIVFPAPVSPVIAVRPVAGDSSPSRTRTRFSMRRLRSKGPAVAGEKRDLGERGEQRALIADAGDGSRTGRQVADPVPVDEHGRMHVRRAVPHAQIA